MKWETQTKSVLIPMWTLRIRQEQVLAESLGFIFFLVVVIMLIFILVICSF